MANLSQTMKIKSVNSNMEVLNKANPEIFDASPRPGGFLKVMVPTRSQDYMALDSCSCPTDRPTTPKRSTMSMTSSRLDRSSRAPDLDFTTASTTSREFRLKRAIEETDWELTAVDETDTVVGISNILHDTINMLAVTISCVMMMAANLQVPEDYLNWAQRYLECIKDEEGVNPPNILGIQGEIMKRQDNPNYKSSSTSSGKRSPILKTDKSPKSSSTKISKSKSGSSSSKLREGKSGSSSSRLREEREKEVRERIQSQNDNILAAVKPTEEDKETTDKFL